MIGIVQFQAWICFGQPSTESTKKKSKRLALKRKTSGRFSTFCELESSGSNMHAVVLFRSHGADRNASNGHASSYVR